jgi:hypothetical protein
MSAGGVTLIPHSQLMFSGGKEGVIFLLESQRHGEAGRRDTWAPQRFQASNGCGQKDWRANVGNGVLGREHDGVLYVWIDGMFSEPTTSSTTASSRLRPP